MKAGAVRKTRVPDSSDEILLTVAKMVKMVREARRDPLVISTARKIAALSTPGWRPAGAARHLSQLRGIHAWCRTNFSYVNDPADTEVIQTPNRMLRELAIPPQLHKAIWRQVDNVSVIGKMPRPKMTGDADEATVVSLSLAAAVGIGPLKIRLGGFRGRIHTCWGAALVGRAWRDFDVLREKFGSHSGVQLIKEVELPL